MIRKIRRVRQLIPTKFATGYRVPNVAVEQPQPPLVYIEAGSTPTFTTWWMWLGRCFKVRHTAI